MAQPTANPQQATVGHLWRLNISAPLGHPLLPTLELGTLGIGRLGMAETLPILLDFCGKGQLFTAVGFTDHSPVKSLPQNPSRRTLGLLGRNT